MNATLKRPARTPARILACLVFASAVPVGASSAILATTSPATTSLASAASVAIVHPSPPSPPHSAFPALANSTLPSAAKSGRAASCERQDHSLLVQRIFLAKCGECHASHLAEADVKGEFGFLDDLRAIAADDDYVVPGDPEDSILFDSVALPPDDPDAMPPEDSDFFPLTEAELETVRQWILDGARVSDEAQALKGSIGRAANPSPDQAASTSDAAGISTADAITMGAITMGDEAGAVIVAKKPPRERSLMERWQRFLGQFHAASTHLPIGLLLAAVLAELLSTIGHHERLRYVSRFCLLVGFLGASFTATAGWWLAAKEGYAVRPILEPPGMLFADLRGNDIFWHRWLGVISIGVSLVSLCFAVVVERACHRPSATSEQAPRPRRRGLLFLYRAWLMLLAALISLVGFLGGNLVHGAGHYEWL